MRFIDPEMIRTSYIPLACLLAVFIFIVINAFYDRRRLSGAVLNKKIQIIQCIALTGFILATFSGLNVAGSLGYFHKIKFEPTFAVKIKYAVSVLLPYFVSFVATIGLFSWLNRLYEPVDEEESRSSSLLKSLFWMLFILILANSIFHFVSWLFFTYLKMPWLFFTTLMLFLVNIRALFISFLKLIGPVLELKEGVINVWLHFLRLIANKLVDADDIFAARLVGPEGVISVWEKTYLNFAIKQSGGDIENKDNDVIKLPKKLQKSLDERIERIKKASRGKLSTLE